MIRRGMILPFSVWNFAKVSASLSFRTLLHNYLYLSFICQDFSVFDLFTGQNGMSSSAPASGLNAPSGIGGGCGA